MIKNHNKAGFTLVEILLVLAILAILLAIVVPQFARIRENQALKSATSDVLSAINKARSDTLASINSSVYGVHFQSDQVIIFTGQNFSPSAGDNQVIQVVSPVSISNVTLGGVSDSSGNMYFKRLSGAPSASGTITVSSPSSSKVITISTTGATSIN